MNIISMTIAILITMNSGCIQDRGDTAQSSRQVTANLSARDLANQGLRLGINELSYNRLGINGLSTMGEDQIATGRLGINQLDYNTLLGVGTTPEGRELLTYVARCALLEGDVLVLEHDGLTYAFSGLLGLAPEWEHGPLSEEGERWISACLIAHVNAYDVPVPISLRAVGKLDASDDERASFPVYEGTFFGKVLGAPFATYACIGDDPEVANAHSPDRALRACTDPSDDCEVISLGRCRDICDTRSADYGWSDCHVGAEVFHETISVYLADPNTDQMNQTCADDASCVVDQHRDGILECADGDSRAAACRQNSICTLDGTGAYFFQPTVEQGSVAEITCHETAECAPRCSSGSQCEIDCKDAATCDAAVCEQGARCLLDCTGAVDCGFAVCDGPLHVCPGDIVVCNRDCP